MSIIFEHESYVDHIKSPVGGDASRSLEIKLELWENGNMQINYHKNIQEYGMNGCAGVWDNDHIGKWKIENDHLILQESKIEEIFSQYDNYGGPAIVDEDFTTCESDAKHQIPLKDLDKSFSLLDQILKPIDQKKNHIEWVKLCPLDKA